MRLGGIRKRGQHLILFLFDTIMELPITDKELDILIEMSKKYDKKDLYAKLWSYRFYKNVKKEEKEFGFS